jgi:hypothetical protein
MVLFCELSHYWVFLSRLVEELSFVIDVIRKEQLYTDTGVDSTAGDPAGMDSEVRAWLVDEYEGKRSRANRRRMAVQLRGWSSRRGSALPGPAEEASDAPSLIRDIQQHRTLGWINAHGPPPLEALQPVGGLESPFVRGKTRGVPAVAGDGSSDLGILRLTPPSQHRHDPLDLRLPPLRDFYCSDSVVTAKFVGHTDLLFGMVFSLFIKILVM